jgi:mRNA interferase MazF
MRRGEIYFANSNPTIGSEIKKIRPVLVISNNANNKASSTVTILPITSNVSRVYPFEILLHKKVSGLKKDSKVQCQQIRTISKLRINSSAIGRLTEKLMLAVEQATKLHLDMT